MKRLWRIIRWVLAGVVTLVLVVVAAVVVFTRTARFNDFLRVRLVSYLTQTYRGQITIGSIEGSIWGSLTLRDIEVRHRGSAIVSIPQLRVGYQILPALHGQFVLSDVEVIQPTLHFAKDSDGQWNLLAAIAERNPSPPSPPLAISVALQRFAIEQAAVSVTTAPAATYRLSNGNFSGAGQMGLSGQSFKLATIAFAINGPGMLPLRAQGALDYSEARQVATIRIPNFSIYTSRSQIDLSATLRDLSAKIVDATVNVRKLSAADVNSLAPQANLARDITGSVRVSGNIADLRAIAALAAGDARLRADLRADLSKPQPVWSLQTQLAKVDLRKLLKRKDLQNFPAGMIDATLRGQGVGTAAASAAGTVDARVTGLTLSGTHLGDASMAAAVKGQAANFKALLAGPAGRAQLSGRVNIAKQPAYNLTLALDHLRPASLIRTAGIPPADLSLTSTIDGSGYQPDTMRTRVQMRLLPSTVGAVRIDGGRVDAQLASGIVQIAGATLNAGDTTASATGHLALNPKGSGRLNYQVNVGQASRWLAIAGQRGSGRIDLSGQADGNLRSLRTSGAAELSALKLKNYSAGHARLTYSIAGLGSPLKPNGEVTLAVTDLHAGVELKSLQSNVRIVSGATQTATLDLSIEDRLSHPGSLRAEISYRPALLVVNLSRMVVATSEGSWQLASPAQFTRKGPEIAIHRFQLANQGRNVSLDGTLSVLGAQDLTARIQGMPLADLSGFVPGQVKILGVASSDLTVRGSASAPVIAFSANIASLNVAGIPQAGLSARATYAGGRAQAEATLAQNATHSLAVSAALPIQLSWARGFESRITGDVNLRAFSSGLDLAVFNSIRNPQVSAIGGALSLEVAAHGPLRHPVPHGFIRLSDGHALIRQTKVEITAASADLELGPSEVRLVSLSAKAGGGSMTGAGALALAPDGRPGRLNLRVALDQWPAIATHQYNATIAAHFDATGTPAALDVGGQIEVLYGVFRPDLSVAGGAPRPDQTVTVVQRWSETPYQPPPPALAAPAGPLPDNLALDLHVVVDRNTWIKTADFAVELAGDVHVHKKRHGRLIVFGTIDTVRGTLVVAHREFDLARGHIRFTGGHRINPELDLVAQYHAQNYLVSATVSGTADKPTLTLSSIPELPQADILSVMMFGKPSSQLSGGQQKDLQNQAMSMAGGYAASQVGQAVAQALGLGDLGVTTNSGGVGFGRYLSKNVYVSASQSAANMQDRRAEIHYYITPSVDLNTSASTNYGNEIKLQWHKEY